jgi:hypothetical protein
MASRETDSVRGNFVLLRAGSLRLLLPQAEVGAAIYLEPRPVAGTAPGLLQSPDGEDARAFFALSPRMGLGRQCPPDRFVGAPFTNDPATVWCWSELRVMIDASLQWQPLPAILCGSGSPLSSFTVLDNEPVFACGADALLAGALTRGVDDEA